MRIYKNMICKNDFAPLLEDNPPQQISLTIELKD